MPLVCTPRNLTSSSRLTAPVVRGDNALAVIILGLVSRANICDRPIGTDCQGRPPLLNGRCRPREKDPRAIVTWATCINDRVQVRTHVPHVFPRENTPLPFFCPQSRQPQNLNTLSLPIPREFLLQMIPKSSKIAYKRAFIHLQTLN